MADETAPLDNLNPRNSAPSRPYRSHKVPACDFCHRRKSRCDRARLDEPCALCRTHHNDCKTSIKERASSRRMAGHARYLRSRKSTPAASPAVTETNLPAQDFHNLALGTTSLESASSIATLPAVGAAGLSGHIVGPALARDAQMLEQFISPKDDIAESHVHPNPYSVYSDDPRNPVVYMKVPRQRTTASSGNGTSGFKQCEILEKILEPLGPDLVELYFNVIHPSFPVLDEIAVTKAYKQGSLPHTLICEIYAVSLVFWGLSDRIAASGRPPPDVRYIWNVAVSAMHDDFHSPSFSTVLSCILDLLGRPITSITYNAINVGGAVALAQSLGLNRNPGKWNLDLRQKNLRVKAWWALLIHDYWASLCHGTPSHIHRDQWDVDLPELRMILDDVPGGEASVLDSRIRGAHVFIALCRLTKILGEVLPVIYSVREEPLEHTLKILRRVEASVDDWQDALPSWLNPAGDEFERDQPGSLNLRLSFLALKICLYRVALQATRINDPEEAAYHKSRCIKAGNALINFIVSLSIGDTRAFWLPYTAYHFASAATLMMRCALEAQSDSVADDCVSSARTLIDHLRKLKSEANWDLADICLGQCETTVKRMGEDGYLKFWRRTKEVGRPRLGQDQAEQLRSLSSEPAYMDTMASSVPAPGGADVVALPEPFASIPREPLLFGSSPIQYLPRISKALGGNVAIYAKREDCNSGLAFGGNKTRKLEYFVPDVLAQGCDTLTSIGGVQSNHTRQVAAVAAKMGLKAAVVQEKWVNWEDPVYEKAGNIQLSRLMNARTILDPSPFGIEHKPTLKNLQDELVAAGRKPYYIPAGASDHPLGGLGFARWAFEVEKQEKEMGVFFDVVIVCAVTGSTMAGMVAGFKLAEKGGSRHRKVIGIDASAKVKQTAEQVLRIAKATGVKIGLQEDDITESDIILDDRYHGGVYGVPDQQTIDAIRFGAETEAFITDPVYEGKSLAGMMDMVKLGEIPAGSNVLYAHLGGQLALNAYTSM
ncbi:1-aminocyclopropane-1-carboxylate [Thozetella sp. PMI_491]|nr:1-aminocyclopropane-1-carboxylate [Thozetella sp. PMI_491]